MPKDENGIDPKAKDGQPKGKTREEQAADDELAMRRARQEESDRQAAEAMGAKPGRSIDDQPEEPEPTEAELFPMGSIPGERSVTMKNIVPAGKARKAEAKMRATPIPMRDGLRRYGDLVDLIVTVEAGKIEEVPDLEEEDAGGRRKLLGVKDVQHFRPVHVADASELMTPDQVMDILERSFGIPRSADKVQEVFGLKPTAAAAAG